MELDTDVYYSKMMDPWQNLAFEEFLFESLPDKTSYLFLYCNNPTVVIGRNQNPWKECCLETMRSDNVVLARRISGGGAVYHDAGNLNFSFMLPKHQFDYDRQFAMLLSILQQVGITARVTDRRDIRVGDKKFSGNSFCFRGNRALHHGTLMIDVDLKRLTSYLEVRKNMISTNAIASVPSSVVNLTDINSQLNKDCIVELIIAAFQKDYGTRGGMTTIDRLPADNELQNIYHRHTRWDWQYGETPAFTWGMRNQFVWGWDFFTFQLIKGKVNDLLIESDTLHAEYIDDIKARVRGCICNGPELAKALLLSDTSDPRYIYYSEIAQWLHNGGF